MFNNNIIDALPIYEYLVCSSVWQKHSNYNLRRQQSNHYYQQIVVTLNFTT